MASLGSLVVSLAMDTAKFQGDIGKAAQQMQRMRVEAAQMGRAVGLAISAGAGIAALMVRNTVHAGIEIQNLAQIAGTTTTELQRLAAGAGIVGTSQEKLADILKDVQDKVGDFLQNGGGPLKDFFDNIAPRVGVTAQQFRNLSGPQALQLYVSSLEKANLSQSEMVFYMEAVASDSSALLPLLRNGGEGFRRYGDQAERLGAIIGGDVLEQSRRLQEQMALLDMVKQGLANSITRELLPTLTNLSSQLLDSAEKSGTLDTAARAAAAGVRILLSAGALIVGVFKTLGEGIGGVAAGLVALFAGRFREAFEIAKSTTVDVVANLKGTVNTVAAIWDDTGAKVEAGAERTSTRLASPLIKAAGKAAKAAKAIKTEAEKIYEEIERQLGTLQFQVDTQGASERIRGLIELTQKGATGEQIRRYLALAGSIETYQRAQEKAATADADRRAVLEEIQAAYDATRTPAEKLANEISRLNSLREQGMDWDTYARGVFAAQDAFDAASKKVHEWDQFSKNAAENIQRNLGDTFVDAMNRNFKGIRESFTAMVQRMVAEATAAQLARKMFGGMVEGGSGSGWFGAALSAVGSFMGFGGRAGGNPVSPYHAYDVGEHGRETFIPTTAGTIVPASQGMTVIQHFHLSQPADRRTQMQIGADASSGLQRAMRNR